MSKPVPQTPRPSLWAVALLFLSTSFALVSIVLISTDLGLI